MISSLQLEFRVKGDNYKLKKEEYGGPTLQLQYMGYPQDYNTSQFLSEYSQNHKLNVEMGHL